MRGAFASIEACEQFLFGKCLMIGNKLCLIVFMIVSILNCTGQKRHVEGPLTLVVKPIFHATAARVKRGHPDR